MLKQQKIMILLQLNRMGYKYMADNIWKRLDMLNWIHKLMSDIKEYNEEVQELFVRFID